MDPLSDVLRAVRLNGVFFTEWRLQLAAEQLAGGGKKVAPVAADVGYESEAAFSRAFKRRTGHAPAGWRRMRQGPGGGDAISA